MNETKEWEFTKENIENKNFTNIGIHFKYHNLISPLPDRSSIIKFYVSTPFKEKETQEFPINAKKLVNNFLDVYYSKTLNRYHQSLRHGSKQNCININYYPRNYVEKCRTFFKEGSCYGLKDFKYLINHNKEGTRQPS